jgi:hypothetical protein
MTFDEKLNEAANNYAMGHHAIAPKDITDAMAFKAGATWAKDYLDHQTTKHVNAYLNASGENSILWSALIEIKTIVDNYKVTAIIESALGQLRKLHSNG